jgi:hypothetical protein
MTPVQPKIIYVDADAPGPVHDGSSWATAYKYLQDALTDANSIGEPVEIRVAEGIYTPDSNSADPNGTGDRTATFQLVNGVTLKGGFAGFGQPDPNARDIGLYESVLSGDLAGNDVDFINPVDLYDHPTWSENSYHVVTGSGTNKSAVLDGFTITAGNANAVYQYDTNAVGGGMYNNQGRATVANCTFIHNLTLWNGGAMYNEGSNLTLTNCTFTENSSIGFNGAGMFNYESSPILTNCTFSNNIAYYDDCAGMYNRRHCSPTLTNCTFIGNKGDGMSNYFDSNATLTDCSFSGNTGCGMANWQSSPTLTGCRFDGNGQGGMANRSGSIPILTNCIITRNSSTRGAGMYNNNSSPILTNCIFSGNRAGDWAGGMYNRYLSSPILTNCTFIGNRAWRWGGGMYNNGLSGECNPILTNCTFADNLAGRYGGGILNQSCRPTVTNCIVWSNLPEQIFDQYTSASSVTFSDVQDGWAGEGNIDAAPCFVEPGYWDDNNTPDYKLDDIWMDGDYRLWAGSPCIDAGTDAGVYEGIDGNIRPFDFPGVDNNGELPDFDMGAYEAIATTQGELIILPRTINRTSRRETISAVLRLPESIITDDIDVDEPLVVFPGAVEAAGQSIIPPGKAAQSSVKIHAVFDKADLLAAMPDNGEVELTVVGRLNTGEYFYGTDTVRIIGSHD